MTKQVVRQIKKMLLMQIGLAGLLGSFLWLTVGYRAAYSSFLGGGVVMMTTALFVWVAFRYQSAQAVKHIMWRFYWAEIMKLLMAAGLFCFVFKYVTLCAAAFFIGLIVVQLSYWVAPWWLKF